MPRISRAAVVVTACLVAGLVSACSQGSTPASPTPGFSATATGQTADPGTPVALTGLVRRLDMNGRSFLLVTRTGSCLVVWDTDTYLYAGGVRVRFGSLRVGLTVGVRAVDHGGFALARTISIVSR